jgi:uncharacterized protein (DUF302 family)
MSDYGRRIAIDSDFETAVGDVGRAIREEGLQVIARFDVRDHLARQSGDDFRRYLLLQAWSPDLAREAFRHSLDVGTILPTTFAVYELADGETAVIANEGFASVVEELAWRHEVPALAAIADREADRVARVLARLQRESGNRVVSPAA